MLNKPVRGQKVVLNEAGLRYKYSTAGAPARKRPVQWQNRVGIIDVVSLDKQRVQIIWDGNRTKDDAIHIKFLETVEEP